MTDAATVLDLCRRRGWRLATAESCTGGLIAARLTDVAGSSDVVEGGLVAYDNRVKECQLGVEHALLAREGAVSEPVARAMAEGARRLFATDVAVAVTGIAGPGGATATKPVGLVHLAVADGAQTRHAVHVFAGHRDAVREAAVAAALELVASAARSG